MSCLGRARVANYVARRLLSQKRVARPVPDVVLTHVQPDGLAVQPSGVGCIYPRWAGGSSEAALQRCRSRIALWCESRLRADRVGHPLHGGPALDRQRLVKGHRFHDGAQRPDVAAHLHEEVALRHPDRVGDDPRWGEPGVGVDRT
jgi:hypothetical protein